MRIMTYPDNWGSIDLERVLAFVRPLVSQSKQQIHLHQSVGTFLVMGVTSLLCVLCLMMGADKKVEGLAWSNGVVTLKGVTRTLPGPLLSFKLPDSLPPMAPWVVKELSNKNTVELEELMLAGVPTDLRPKAQLLLPSLLSACERYGVDPFWAMAIMWTESHFRQNAQSYAGAYGPMQVMPATAHYLLWRMGERVDAKEAARLRKIPSRNVDLGVAYLAELLVQFGGNYKWATIAYNMGPYGLKRALKSGRPIGQNHRYWKRVVGHLKLLLDGAAPRLGPWRQFSEKTLEKYAEGGSQWPLLGSTR